MLLPLLACTSAGPVDSDALEPTWLVPRFEWVQGLDEPGLGRGVVVRDVDEDGDLDVLRASSVSAERPESTVTLYLQQPGRGFLSATQDWGLQVQLDAWGLLPVPDQGVLVTGGGWNEAAENLWLELDAEGSSTSPGPEGACGVGATMGAALSDLDQDGRPDLVAANGNAHRLGGCVDVHWGTEAGFELAEGLGEGSRTGFGVASADLTGDGFPEIVVAEDVGLRVYRNLGAPPWFALDDPQEQVAWRVRPLDGDEEWDMATLTTLLLDVDQDGDLDLFGCTSADPTDPSHGEVQLLLRNDGPLAFTDVSVEAGVQRGAGCMGSGTGDLDLNGFPDLYLGTGGPGEDNDVDNVLYMNVGGGFFEDATEAAGMGLRGRTHGIEFTDLDEDGVMDAVINSGGALAGQEEALRVGYGEQGMRGVRVRLEGPELNPEAIGARLVAETDVGTFYSWALRGQGFGSASTGPMLLGVGRASELRLRAELPEGVVQTELLELPLSEEIVLAW